MWPSALDDLRQRRRARCARRRAGRPRRPAPTPRCRSPRTVAICAGAIPALATATSRPPKRSTVSATAAIIAPVVGDVGADPDRPLADPLGRLARLRRRRGRATATEAPRMCIWRAVSKPIPRAAPVTSATFPLQVVDGHRPQRTARPAAGQLATPRIARSRCPASAQSTRSSPSPSWRSGSWSAGASATSSTARSPTARGPRSGASTRARRPPTAAPAPTTSSPASSRTSTRATGRCAATGCRARRAGTATACRSSSRSKKQLGISSKQEIEEYGIAEFNAALPRVGLRVRRGVEPADRADRLLDRPRRPLRHPRRRLHRVGLVVAAQALGRGPPLRGPQGRPLLPALRHGALLARGRARLQGRRGPLHLRALPAARRGRRARRASRCWSGRRRPGPCPATSRSRSPRRHLRAGAGRGRDPDPRRAAGREGARRGRRDRRPLPGLRAGRPPLRGPGLRRSPTASRGGFPVLAGDFVTTEDGTGLVHIAPAFGEDDYAVAAANGIFDPTDHGTLYNPVGLDGTFDDRVTGFEGRFVKDPEVTARADRRPRAPRPALPRAGLRARLPALLALRHAAALLRQVELVHRAPRRPATQLLANNETIGWHPEHIKHGRFGKWLENNVDWALSPRPLLGHAAADLGVQRRGLRRALLRRLGRRAARARRRRGPRRPPPPLHRRGRRSTASSCGGEMRRVESVIDTWYDSGAMPFAQFHYPFENEEQFEERFPADYICEAIDQTRGWFYTLLAESTLLFDELQLPQLRLPRPDPRPRGPEDVEEQRQRGRALGRDRRPRRRRLPLVLPDRPAALVGLPLLGRHGRRVGAPVPAHPLEHLLLLGPLRERRGPRPSRLRAAAARAGRRPRPLGALAPAGDDRDGRASAWTTSTAPPPGGRSPSTSRSSPTGTCGSRAGASGTATGPPSRPCATACWRRPRCSRPFTPFLADEIHLNLAGGEAGELGELPDSVHLRDFPERRPGPRRPRAGGGDGGGAPAPSSSAAPPAPRPRRRCASRCAAR